MSIALHLQWLAAGSSESVSYLRSQLSGKSIVFFGRLEERKGLSLFLDALGLIKLVQWPFRSLESYAPP